MFFLAPWAVATVGKHRARAIVPAYHDYVGTGKIALFPRGLLTLCQMK